MHISPPRPHVMVVLGTRPEVIKMMPIIMALRARQEFHLTVCSTGQHRQMLDQVFAAFGTPSPDLDLDVMQPQQSLAGLTARLLTSMGTVLAEQKPDMVLVHGDTTTALGAAMAAFYARIPIGHVEAGLRSFDLQRPWPEEFNRVAVDAIADLMFAPTASAAENLRNEYNRRGEVIVTGNTGIDALLQIAARIAGDEALQQRLAARYPFLDGGRRLVLVTGHRRESLGDGFRQICDGLLQLAQREDVQVVYPVHLNPAVQGIVREKLSASRNIHLIAPVEYTDMVWLMQQAQVLLTDSGGMQEEGPALGKPVLVMREVTERPEAIETGVVQLVGTDPARMVAATARLLDDAEHYARTARPVFPYGDGQAAARILDALRRRFDLPLPH